MRNRFLLSLLALVSIVGLLLLAVFTRGNSAGSRDVPAARSAPDGKRESLSPPETAAPPQRELETPLPAFTPMARWSQAPIRLVAVERDSNQPIPGASITYLAGDETPRRFVGDGSDSFGPDPESYLREHGRTLIADAGGAVEVPTGLHSTFVCGRKDELFGWKHFEAFEAGERRIELEHQDELSVRVVDDLGAAAARAPIWFGFCDGDQPEMRILADEKGDLRIRNFTSCLREMSLLDKPAFEVRVDCVAEPRAMCWIDPRHVPGEPVVLTLPSSGTLQIEVTDADGIPWHRPGKLSIRPAPAMSIQEDLRTTVWMHVDCEDLASNSVAVPIGLVLIAAAECDCGGSVLANVPAVSARGQTARVRLSMNPNVACVTGRVVGDDGKPMANRRLRLVSCSNLPDDRASCRNDPLITDAMGRFVITQRSEAEWILDSATEFHARGARLDPSRWPKTGVFDLGDVALSALEPLVHGHVEDASGSRVAGALISLGKQHAGPFNFDDPLQNSGPTSSTGEFAFYLPRIDGELVLSVYTGGQRFRMRPPSQPVSRPMEDVEQVLRLEALGEIDGTLMLDDASQYPQLEMRISDERPFYPEGILAGHEFRFRFEGVAPGTHTFSVESRSNDLRTAAPPAVVFASVEGIEVRAGEVTRDRRLQPLDLRSKLPLHIRHDVEFRVVDAAGASVGFGRSWLWSAPSSLFDALRWSNGRVQVPDEGIESIDVWAQGMRVSNSLVRDLQAPIVLRAECDVRLALDQVHALIAAGNRVVVTLTSTDNTERTKSLRYALGQSRMSSLVDATGESRFRTAVPGHFSLRVDLLRMDSLTDKPMDQRILQPDPATATIEVRDEDGPQRFDVHLDAKELEEVELSFGSPGKH